MGEGVPQVPVGVCVPSVSRSGPSNPDRLRPPGVRPERPPTYPSSSPSVVPLLRDRGEQGTRVGRRRQGPQVWGRNMGLPTGNERSDGRGGTVVVWGVGSRGERRGDTRGKGL